MLAQELERAFASNEFDVSCRGRPELDLGNRESIQQALHQGQPELIINAAAYTAVDQAETDIDAAFLINRDGARWLAESCHSAGIPLIHVSTDFVFNGEHSRPYQEDDRASPLGVYGQSKWEGEEAVRACLDRHIILRTAWLYSMYGRNFVKTILGKAQAGQELRIVNDQWGCPTWVRDVAAALVGLAQRIRDEPKIPWGTYHFCSSGQTTWYGFARAIITEAQAISPFSCPEIIPIPSTDYPTPATRPAYSVLDCSKIQRTFGLKAPDWAASMPQCIKELLACPDSRHR